MGPETEIGKWIHQWKYRQKGEDFREFSNRVSGALTETRDEFVTFRDIIRNQRFLPGGRIQSAVGSAREVTPYNCFVMDTIEDDTSSILKAHADAFNTMRLGGGVGYDFSRLRPAGDRIRSLDSIASGPVSFMGMFDAACKTISSAGHRRGAQMGVLRVDHPAIQEFIHAKQNSTNLTAFNVSVGITDEFMEAVRSGSRFTLRFNGESRGSVHAPTLWEQIMRSTWDWAAPGVLFIDRINKTNNLRYCETISATNPCGEQPLPPNGACLLGSFNLVKYVIPQEVGYVFDWFALQEDISSVVRAMDRVIDVATYPLEEQELEAKNKRRMGLGITGLANAGEVLGFPYGSEAFLHFTRDIMRALRTNSYAASIRLAKEKGPFPLFKAEEYLAEGTFASTLPPYFVDQIKEHGIRNSHLISIAPTGTISISADNVSSGIEPVFSIRYDRTIQTETGARVVPVIDYAKRVWGVDGKTADQCTADDHLGVLLAVQEYVDSACSKTCNVSPDMPWEDFKAIYMKAWEGGAKGCTTFNPGGKRFGVLVAPENKEAEEPLACYVDPETGERSCE